MDVTKTNIFFAAARLDEQAFEQAFHRYYPTVYAVLFRLVGDADMADDLTAETFWQLWQQPPPRADNLGGWLYRVATRLGYNALRAGRRRAAYEASEERAGPPDPADAAEARLERARVRAILRQMPLREVQLLVLRHSGLSYKEVAAALEISTGSVGTLLARAEARFARLYREGEEHAPD